MPSIGETLREARLRQGVEITEVEQATKIRGKYLRALEAEEFDRLPGATFVRTFLRTYAEYLGLDAQVLVEEFRTRHESPGEEDAHALPPAPPPRPRGREGRRLAGPGGGPGRGALVAGALAAIVGLLLLIGLLSGNGDDGEEGRPAAAEDRQGRQGQGGGGGRQGGGQSAAEGVRLRVAPLGETYVCVVDADGEEIFEQTIAEPETFEGESLRVNFGNTEVELRLNGEELEIEQGGNPVALEFTPEGEEELPESERPCT